VYRLQTIYKIILWQEEEHRQSKNQPHLEGHKGHQGLE
jgi:hypothetical protein